MAGIRRSDHQALAGVVNRFGEVLSSMPKAPDLDEQDFQLLDRLTGLYRKMRIVESVMGQYLIDGQLRWPTHSYKIPVPRT